jgi:hypothetical protein
MPTRALPRVLAALAAAALVSCGGGSSGPSLDPTYTITLRYCSSSSTTSCVPADLTEFPQEWRDAFEAAASRLRTIITAGPAPVNVNLDCGSAPNAIHIQENVHGLLILASMTSFTNNQILAQSGPCVVRSRSQLPIVSVMRFNASQMAGQITAGTLDDVVLHEMFHTLGFGTIWCDVSPPLLPNVTFDSSGVCSAGFRYTGPQALAAAKTYNGAPSTWTTVPVEDTGGPGTMLSHWRESVYHNELMTGWIDATDPLSATSIASLADLGYAVDLTKADPFVLVSPPALRLATPGVFVGDDLIHERPAVVDEP